MEGAEINKSLLALKECIRLECTVGYCTLLQVTVHQTEQNLEKIFWYSFFFVESSSFFGVKYVHTNKCSDTSMQV